MRKSMVWNDSVECWLMIVTGEFNGMGAFDVCVWNEVRIETSRAAVMKVIT